ncbi:7-cyano-7-deazaguanine reductase [gamma proteobacterium HTCC5015]|nr:7-cyano-7-deazaguanine reductase [gamma proteobacterium HTCC5015]
MSDVPPDQNHWVLGRAVSYPRHYEPRQLQAIPRQLARDDLGLSASALPFYGEDIWTAYEVSWLNAKGKPCVGVATVRVPCDSANMVESKSFKLYLNSFNQTRFEHLDDVQAAVARDLSQTVGRPVTCQLDALQCFEGTAIAALEGECIDGLDIEFADEEVVDSPRSDYLHAEGAVVEESLVSHLLKSNCRITSQPDWASVQIRYRGAAIDREGLLRYLVSFRQHDEFHEPCVEKIFMDILRQCRPESLRVYARYTRRGGLDINPMRSTEPLEGAALVNQRLPRQ